LAKNVGIRAEITTINLPSYFDALDSFTLFAILCNTSIFLPFLLTSTRPFPSHQFLLPGYILSASTMGFKANALLARSISWIVGDSTENRLGNLRPLVREVLLSIYTGQTTTISLFCMIIIMAGGLINVSIANAKMGLKISGSYPGENCVSATKLQNL